MEACSAVKEWKENYESKCKMDPGAVVFVEEKIPLRMYDLSFQNLL